MARHAKVRGGLSLPHGDPRTTEEGNWVNVLCESETKILAAMYDMDENGPVESYGTIAKDDVLELTGTQELSDEANWPQFVTVN